MTIGALFANSYRRDAGRMARNALTKRANQNQSSPATTTSSKSSSYATTTTTTASTKTQENKYYEILEEDLGPWFFTPY